ncbi:ComEC/Rec2 family competence protein, partial [Candidatus Curtissbacteria bacterium]|nr:ComEC/Rec2 family competence protein [Candidatus Curtissbacteria bacterium]
MLKAPLTLALATIILGLAVAWRVSTQTAQVIPKNQPLKLQATLKNESKIYDRSQVLAIGDSKFYVDLYPRYRVGDKLIIEGEIDGAGRSYSPKIELVGREANLATTFAGLRAKIAQNVSGLLPAREATLLSGTVLGVDEIDREFRDLLVKTGTIHVVVVSGQNLAIVAGVFLSLTRYLGRRESLAAAVLAVFFYALLSGFEPPVIRACIMVILGAIAIYSGRESLPIWNLVMAALLIVFIWPRALFEISFQLTFAATLGIMTLGRLLLDLFAGPAALHPRPTASLVLSPASTTPT